MALLASAMREHAGRPDPISITLHYLAPLPAGDFEITTQVIKRGRMFCTVTASMVVNGRIAVRAIGAFSEAPAHDHGMQHHGIALTEVPPFEQCTRRTAEGEIVPLALMSKLDMRLHPDDRGFAAGLRLPTADQTTRCRCCLRPMRFHRQCSTCWPYLVGCQLWSSPCTFGQCHRLAHCDANLRRKKSRAECLRKTALSGTNTER